MSRYAQRIFDRELRKDRISDFEYKAMVSAVDFGFCDHHRSIAYDVLWYVIDAERRGRTDIDPDRVCLMLSVDELDLEICLQSWFELGVVFIDSSRRHVIARLPDDLRRLFKIDQEHIIRCISQGRVSGRIKSDLPDRVCRH